MDFLKDLLLANKVSGAVAEIGTLAGEGSTKVLLDYAKSMGTAFYAVDSFTNNIYYKKVLTQLEQVPRAEAVKGLSAEIGKTWDRPLDFLFIDGDHNFPHLSPEGLQTGAVFDIMAWHPHLNTGGILAFHDYHGTDTHYGLVDLLGVEYAIDTLCAPPVYRRVGRLGSIIAFKKMSDGLLFPRVKGKQVPDDYKPAWQALNDSADKFPRIIIYGTGSSAKYAYDAICLRWGEQVPEIVFTDSFTEHPTRIFGGHPVVPYRDLVNKSGCWVIASLFEKEIREVMHAAGKKHLADYYTLFEFVGWCHIGNSSRI